MYPVAMLLLTPHDIFGGRGQHGLLQAIEAVDCEIRPVCGLIPRCPDLFQMALRKVEMNLGTELHDEFLYHPVRKQDSERLVRVGQPQTVV
jgi:hypothetical protein